VIVIVGRTRKKQKEENLRHAKLHDSRVVCGRVCDGTGAWLVGCQRFASEVPCEMSIGGSEGTRYSCERVSVGDEGKQGSGSHHSQSHGPKTLSTTMSSNTESMIIIIEMNNDS
jgi:hypothetical protein